MELKKNEKYDLEPKRPLFFGIGMIISLSLALVAFEWKSPIDPIIELNADYEEFTPIAIPPTTIKPPSPPPVTPPVIKETIEEPEIEPDLIIDVDTTPEEVIDFVPPIELDDEEVEEAPINWAEVMPSFKGGMQQFYVLMSDKLRYPKQAQRMGVEGKVYVQFVVEKDGSLTDLKVVKGIGAGCDEEALRAMKLMPNFIPARQGDVRVRIQMVMPIYFVLK